MRVQIIEINGKFYLQKQVEVQDDPMMGDRLEWRYVRGGFLNLQKMEFDSVEAAENYAKGFKGRKDEYKIVKIFTV